MMIEPKSILKIDPHPGSPMMIMMNVMMMIEPKCILKTDPHPERPSQAQGQVED